MEYVRERLNIECDRRRAFIINIAGRVESSGIILKSAIILTTVFALSPILVKSYPNFEPHKDILVGVAGTAILWLFCGQPSIDSIEKRKVVLWLIDKVIKLKGENSKSWSSFTEPENVRLVFKQKTDCY